MFSRAIGSQVLLGSVLLLAGGGCQPAPAETIFSNDFEVVDGTAPPAGVSKDLAHSGSYSTRLDPATDYGAGWNATWGGAGKPHKIRVRAWVNLPNARLKNALVMEIRRGGSVRYFNLLKLNQVVRRYGQWEPVHKTFVLPDDLEATDQIKCYAWHYDQRQTWYLDDVTLERLD